MVYFQPDLEQSVSILNTSEDVRPVSVLYNGSGIHLITGPVPLVDISKSASRNGAGSIEGYTTRIDLTGKIVTRNTPTSNPEAPNPGGSGIGGTLNAIQGLKDLFSVDGASLEIKCDATNTLFSASGVRIIDFAVNKTDDNWLFTADYTISLEYYEPEPNGPNGNFNVKSTSDSWSIEPIEDSIYQSFTYPTASRMKGETHNPELKPTPPSVGSPVPGGFGGGGSIGGELLSITNIPQYRISHRVSAVGVAPAGSGYDAYLFAKNWVQNRISSAFSQPSPVVSGIGYFFGGPTVPTTTAAFTDTYLYNHLRTTNFSITEGSYEINDTWLAMPTGIKYTEDYSVEASTDDRNIKTVRVQGQIRGLYMTNFSSLSGSNTIPSGGGQISVASESFNTLSGNLPSNILDNISQSSSNTSISSNIYENANNAWLKDIKPYLYNRASIVINSIDRNQNYVNATNPSQPPNNPIYAKESFLNPIPISTTEGHDPRKGTISYSVEYNNKLNLISGVISENISINDTGPTDVFSESFVIGRRLGPILQSLNATTSSRKDVSIDVVVPPPSDAAGILLTNAKCPLFTGGAIYNNIETIIEALRPFGARTQLFGTIRPQQPGLSYVSQNNHSWNPAEGRYSRSVSWTYQQCSNNTNYLNH